MLRQDDGTLARVSWDGALDRVANAFKDIVERPRDPTQLRSISSGPAV